MFTRSLWQLIAPDAFWINPLASRQRSTAKPVQLLEAVRVGLTVPPTLCSNDPRRIRSFLKHHQGQVIYKPYYPAQWVMKDGCAIMFTSSLGADDLPDDDVLRLTPGIFQKLIAKDFELRLTYMGDHIVAAKLLSQDVAAGRLDWRLAFSELPVLPFEIPASVDRACRLLLRKLGLVFACVDMIVTPEEDYVFLEVNEMGQFLWLEELNPELRLLDPFCEFLAQGRTDFAWRRSPDNLRFADLRAAAEARQRDVLSRFHVTTPSCVSVLD
jgi:hypothetical protein